MTNLSLLESIPYDLMGTILTHLFKDDPYRFENNITSLMLTNKKIYALVNSERTINSFWVTLKDKNTLEEFAAFNNTKRTRRWLYDYAVKQGYDTAYKEIYLFFDTINELIKNLGLFDPTYKRGFPILSPLRYPDIVKVKRITLCYTYNKTKAALFTPFGKIDLFDTYHLEAEKAQLLNKVSEISRFKLSDSNILNEILMPYNHRFEPYLTNKIWDLFERNRLGVDPFTTNSGFNDALSIINAMKGLIDRVKECPTIEISFLGKIKKLPYKTIDDLPFKSKLFSRILDDFRVETSSNEKTYASRHFEIEEIVFPFSSYEDPIMRLDREKSKYTLIFDSIRGPWRVEDPRKHLNAIDQNLEKDFFFYVQEDKSLNYWNLMTNLLDVFKLRSSIKITRSEKVSKTICLSIEKAKYKIVVEKLNLFFE